MDYAEARHLGSGAQTSSTPVKKITVTSGERVSKSSEESVTSTTTTETVVGSQAVAALDAEVSPRWKNTNHSRPYARARTRLS